MDPLRTENFKFFFLGTGALTLCQYIDRFFIQYYKGETHVGIYTFYTTIANVIQVFLITGLINILYPKLVGAYQKGQLEVYRSLIRKMTVGVIVGGACFIILVIAGVKIMLMVVDKPIYANNITVFWILLSAVYVGSVVLIPHYALYARKADKQIVTGALIVLPISIIGNYLLVPIYGIIGSAMSVLISNLILLILYMYFLLTFKKGQSST